MKKMGLAVLLLGLATTGFAAVCESKCEVVSPQKKVTVNVCVGPTLTYDVSFDGEKVVLPSPLGLAFKDQTPLGAMEVVRVETTLIDKTWKNRFSKKSMYRDFCTEETITLREKGALGRMLTLVVRAYDDGVAFRYVLPEQKMKDFVLADDLTQFVFGGDWDAFASDQGKFNTSQEKQFPKMKLSEIKKDAVVICPLVVQSPKFCCAITEAELTSWAGMQFAHGDAENSIRLRLTPRNDGNGVVVAQTPAQSPWRVILLGKKPVDLVNNSGIILNVSTPCQLADTDWIQPGASSWDWWSEGNRILNTDTFKQRVDLAAAMGWKYTTLDDPWYFDAWKPTCNTMKGCGTVDLPEAFAYAKSKGIGVFLWLHYKDLEKSGMEESFATFEKWGAAGVKIDFMDSDYQERVEWIANVVKLCAKYHLMVNFHGMYKPTGLERAYPNQITREGILGNEYNKFSNKITTRHSATLPFTRFLCGPGDFTPGGFLNVHPEKFRTQEKLQLPPCVEMGTRAHALAMCLVCDSPLLTICDAPENYKNQPGLDFLKNIPAVWDETTAIDGAIGEYYLAVRRSGNQFYAAAITNEEARKLSLPLTFLKVGQTYEVTLYADVPESATEATKISVTKKTVTSTDTLSIDMVRNGGWTAVFNEQ
ncbi:MAG: glycoside hydrolase family 97 protein [Planctomycetia bacterium]|nr:glycoside hydrolase family 97 protein [Planctomycetia bacterium]